MITLQLMTGRQVHLVRQHIVSVMPNNQAPGSIIRMSNRDQWAVAENADDIISGWDVRR